jgi:hypothetical protein
MKLALRLNRSKAADLIIAMLALTPAIVIYYESYSPEAAIYFTFIKNFFRLPFSFQPDTVSFGATSPLHVMLHAPVYAMFGSAWLAVSKFVNLVLVAFGMVLINRALKGGTKTILLISLLVAMSTALLVSTSQLFESGLAFFMLAWLYHDLSGLRYGRATLIAGSLYLVRPELIVITAAAMAYCIVQSQASRRSIIFAVVSLLPAAAYHIYMLAATGSILPASAFTPIITYIQDPSSWLARVGGTLAALWSPSGLIYIACAVVILLLLTEWSLPRYSREMLLIAPLVGLYMLFPPQEEIVRYLVPIVPILIALVVRYVQQDVKAQYSVRALIMVLIMAHAYGSVAHFRQPTPDYNAALATDLSTKLKRVAPKHARVLLWDVQSQYHMDGACLSLSSAVGNDMVDVYLRRTSAEDFFADQNVDYLVTGDALAQAPFAETMFERIHRHDRSSDVGDTVMAGGFALEKVISNPAVADPSGTAESQARWHSVYAVLGDVATVRAEKAARAYAAQQAQQARDNAALGISPDSLGRAMPQAPPDTAATPDTDPTGG